MSDLDPRTQQVIAEGEAAWLKVSSGNWDESAWKIMGTALTLIRQQVLFDLGTNVARGSIYNTAFARRLDGTAFKSMDANTRSNLLFVMEPANRIVLDRLMAAWTPSRRARRTHPTTLAQAIRTALRPPKPEPQAKRQAADNDALFATLPKTTQQRMAAWQRKRVDEMQKSFEAAVHQKAYEWLDATGLPLWKRYVDEAKKIYDLRKGIMDKDTFMLIWSCLHPDSRRSVSDKKLAEAFDKFNSFEKKLLVEKDSPTKAPTLPETIAGWKRTVKTRPPKPAPGTHRRLG
jgi:hypothetical protein